MAGRENIPFLDIKGFQGLYTKSSSEMLQAEQLQIAQNCDYFEEYGAVSKIRGSSRVLSETYKEGGVTKEISWVGFYKAPSLDGSILRHTLVAAGGIIGRVDDDKITPLVTGRTAGLYHQATMQDSLLFITNYNPERVGEGDAMVKYDGAVVTKWGVDAPGSQSTIIDAFSNAASWTPNACVLADQSNDTPGEVTWDGDAVRVDHEFYSTDTFSIEKAHGDAEFYPQGDTRQNEDAIRDRVSFFAYIPRGGLTASLTNPTNAGFKTRGPALSVYVSPDGDTVENNNWQFDFTQGWLVEGWNKINLDFASGEPGAARTINTPPGQVKGLFYPESDSIKRTRFEFYMSTAQTTLTGIRVDKYQRFDEGALVASPSGSGDITGLYSYKVVYVSKYGQLSNTGPKSVDVTAASNAQIDLTRIPVSSDTQVVARRIYRTVGGGSVWLFLDEILDNTSTTYTDVLGDGSLGNETAPQAGDYADDNAVPPKCGIVKAWKKTIFMAGDPQNPYTLYYSEDDEGESFPLINALELDEKITGIYESYSGLVVETETGKWQLIGSNPDFSLDKIIHGVGCVGRRACGTARTVGYSVDRDGMRTFDLSETKKISEPIRDKYDDDLDKTNIELIHAVHLRSRNAIVQFNPDADGDYTSIWLYQYVMDQVEAGYWSTIVTPDAANLNFLDAEEIEDSDGTFKLYAGGADGMLYHLFDSSSKNWVDADGTEYAVDTKVQTPYLRVGYLGSEVEQASGRVNPHTLELRIGAEDACIWTATVETARGTMQTLATDSSTLSMEFGTNNSLIRQRVPSKTSTPAEYVRLTLQNAELDVYTKLLAARFYYHVQPAQFDQLAVDNDTE
jgi:hypothetical protein